LRDCLDVRVFDVGKTELSLETRNSASTFDSRVNHKTVSLTFCEVLHSLHEVNLQEHCSPVIFAVNVFSILLIEAPLIVGFFFGSSRSFAELFNSREVPSDDFIFSHLELNERDWFACNLANIVSLALEVESKSHSDSLLGISLSEYLDLISKLVEPWLNKFCRRLF